MSIELATCCLFLILSLLLISVSPKVCEGCGRGGLVCPKAAKDTLTSDDLKAQTERFCHKPNSSLFFLNKQISLTLFLYERQIGKVLN